eukprot:12898316-Prorocentrum_lima.AAC.1
MLFPASRHREYGRGLPELAAELGLLSCRSPSEANLERALGSARCCERGCDRGRRLLEPAAER